MNSKQIQKVLTELKTQFAMMQRPSRAHIANVLDQAIHVLICSFTDRIGKNTGKITEPHIVDEIHCLLIAAKIIRGEHHRMKVGGSFVFMEPGHPWHGQEVIIVGRYKLTRAFKVGLINPEPRLRGTTLTAFPYQLW